MLFSLFCLSQSSSSVSVTVSDVVVLSKKVVLFVFRGCFRVGFDFLYDGICHRYSFTCMFVYLYVPFGCCCSKNVLLVVGVVVVLKLYIFVVLLRFDSDGSLLMLLLNS